MFDRLKAKFLIAFALISIALVTLASAVTAQNSFASSLNSTSTQKNTHKAAPAFPLGIDGDPQTSYPNIPWIRLSYSTCEKNNLSGTALKEAIEAYHNQGIHVLLTICQQSSGSQLFDPNPLNDAAQGGADAVQCGNEQMKNDPPATRYVSPKIFARYFDLCQKIVHNVRSEIPVILGSLDPHVGWIDYPQLFSQALYLDQMQNAMNTSVHPGGHWTWRTQILGLIDSWHNGYPSSFNSLLGLFSFWANEFRLSLSSGNLGKHLWVIEGSGCFKGCGINVKSNYQVAVSHIMTLITDVQTALAFHVPFFYFNGKDFKINDILWPMGILNLKGNPKPLRQDLSMGARTLTMSCQNTKVKIVNQEQLLATLYNGCALPYNYYQTLVR